MYSPTGQRRPAPAPADSPALGSSNQAVLSGPGMPAPPPQVTRRRPAAGDTNGADEKLADLCQELPEFRIWREITCDRTRYVARSLHLGTSPHTVVTDDLDELSDVLRKAHAAQQPGTRTGRPR